MFIEHSPGHAIQEYLLIGKRCGSLNAALRTCNSGISVNMLIGLLDAARAIQEYQLIGKYRFIECNSCNLGTSVNR